MDYPRKVFGEISFKGALDNYGQILRFEYLEPTEKYTGKFAMTLITPNKKGAIEIRKPTVDQLNLWLSQSVNEELKDFLTEVKNSEEQAVGARSFRIPEKEFLLMQSIFLPFFEAYGYLFGINRFANFSEREEFYNILKANAATVCQSVNKAIVDGGKEAFNCKSEAKSCTRKAYEVR